MQILALDTASPVPAVALLAHEAVFEERLPGDRRASEDLLPAIARCLAAAGIRLSDCERIAVCSGPGSFTGLRIGLATAWALGRACGTAVESVSTLAALAEAARREDVSRVGAALDAGRGEVVIGFFDVGGVRARALAPPERVSASEARARSVGSLVFSLPRDLLDPSGAALPVSPAAALALAVGLAPRDDAPSRLEAIYARPSAAEEKRGAS